MIDNLCKRLAIIFMGIYWLMMSMPLSAATLAVNSVVVRSGDIVILPIAISDDVQNVSAFQLDLQVIPSTGAPDLFVDRITKGAAVTTASSIDFHPALPVTSEIRIGLPTEIPPPGEPTPVFGGPGSIAELEMAIPATAVAGQYYRLILDNVILAGPDHAVIPLTVFGGTITIGETTAIADTLAPPTEILEVDEGETSELAFTVTGSGQPVPGVSVVFTTDDPEIAAISVSSAVTGSDGRAMVNVTGLRDGNTIMQAAAPGLETVNVPVTVAGFTPYTTSEPPLEVDAGDTYRYPIAVTDPNGDPVTYALLQAPDGMTIDPGTGLITWTVPIGQPQTGNDVTVQIQDSDGHTSTQSFTVFIRVDGDEDGADNRVDCDDGDPEVYPGQTEVIDNGKDDDCDPSTPDAPPIADFTFTPSQGNPGEPIQFTDASSARVGSIVAWRWAFGDGVIVTEPNPVHVYESGGAYTVSLTVTDDSGVSATIDKPLNVLQAPVVDFRVAPQMNVALAELGGRIVSATSSGPYPPEHVIDGTDAYWHSDTGQITDQRIVVDLAGEELHLIERVVLRRYNINDLSSPKDFEIRVSTTGTEAGDFTTVFTGTMPEYHHPLTPPEFTFDPVPARYVELVMHNNWGHESVISLSEFEVWTREQQSGVVSLQEGGASVVEASSVYLDDPYYAPENAIDYSNDSAWYTTATNKTTDQWLTVRLSGEGTHWIDRILLQGSDNGIENFEIRVSTRGLHPSDFVTVVSGTLPRGDQSHWFSFDPVEARYVQLYILDSYTTSYISVYDFKVYSSQLGAPEVPFTDYSLDADGDIVSWAWDFGDGTTSSEPNPVHSYSAPGVYTITLAVTDNDGLTSSQTTEYTVLPPPEVDFNWSPEPPGESQDIFFTAQATASEGATLVGFQWQFPDWSLPVTGPSTEFEFYDNGVYPVTLTVTDSRLISRSITKPVTVVNLPPSINLTPFITLAWGVDWDVYTVVSDPGRFDSPVCHWDFGDGESLQIDPCPVYGQGQTYIPYAYTHPGEYTATLTATDKDGASTSASCVVTVTTRQSRLGILEGVDESDSGEVEVAARLIDYYNLTHENIDWDLDPPGLLNPLEVADRTVHFNLGAQTVSAVTDTEGVARVRLNVIPSENRLSATFAGDEHYTGSTDADFPLKDGDVLAGIGGGRIGHYDKDGQFLEVLTAYNRGVDISTAVRRPEDTGMCFGSTGRLYATNFSAASVTTFNSRGALLHFPWGGFYPSLDNWPESCVVDAADQVYTGTVCGWCVDKPAIRKFDPEGNLLAEFEVRTEDRGTDWIDLAADQCTMFYTSEGRTVMRYDVCNDVQLEDFATGLERPCYALRLRDNGEVLVACRPRVYRLSPEGQVLQTYERSDYLPQGSLFALNLDPDGTSFWTATYNPGQIVKIDIETGEQLTMIEADVDPSLAGLTVVGELTVATNQRPTADPGGPYQVDEGRSVTLDGTGSTDPNNKPLTYAWDLDDDGQFDEGSEATTPFNGVDDGVFPVQLQVSNGPVSDRGDTTVTVNNVAPTVEAGSDQSATTGDPVALDSATFTDPGVLDTHTATIDWGDGSAAEPGAVSETDGSGRVAGSHRYTTAGAYTVTLTVTDDDGGVGSDTFTVEVSGSAALACDVDGDGDVDLDDIQVIMADRNTPAVAGDPRDHDGNGVIDANDARQCVLECTRPRCQP